MKTKLDKKSVAVKVFFVIALAVLAAIEVIYAIKPFDKNLYLLASRFVGGGACILFMVEFSFTRILSPRGNKRPSLWLLALPAFVIAVNNFPFVSFFAGDCALDADITSVLYYALICLGVGFFEETAFRGCAFMLLLEKRTKSKGQIFLAIFLSSVVFGLIHAFNLIAGASPIATLLQIGYSALIGALCSVVLLLTRNIWACVLLHASYNFCGGIISEFGSGTQWTAAEIIFTAAVSVIIGVYVLVLFLKMPTSLADDLVGKKNIENIENN